MAMNNPDIVQLIKQKLSSNGDAPDDDVTKQIVSALSNNVKRFYNNLIVSPKMIDMLKKSLGTNDNNIVNEYAQQRIKNIGNTNVLFRNGLGIKGMTDFYSGKPTVTIGNSALYDEKGNVIPKIAEQIIGHEISHAEEAKNINIPQSDIDLMTTLQKKNKDVIITPEYLKSVGFEGNLDDDKKENYLNYLKQPTEIRARLNELRLIGKQNKIFDATKEDFTKEHLDKLKDTQPMQQLRQIYSDEDIQKLMNSISYNNNGNFLTNMA